MISHFGLADYQTLTSKRELLNWFNSYSLVSSSPITKIEQLGSGVLYCKMISQVLPEHLSSVKIKVNAKSEWEFLYNFKLLQQAFERVGIQKTIEVDRLVKLKYQDNLEFAQWTKRFFDLNFGGQVDKLINVSHKNTSSTIKSKLLDKIKSKISVIHDEKDVQIIQQDEEAISYQYLLSEVITLSSIVKRIQVKDEKRQDIQLILDLMNQVLSKVGELEAAQ